MKIELSVSGMLILRVFKTKMVNNGFNLIVNNCINWQPTVEEQFTSY